MPSWKKVIVSGSDASLNSLYSPSITGSLQGTASYALTASYAMNGGGGAAFPYTGSATISGSLTVTGPITSTQTISGSRLYVSSSASNTVTIIGSGSDLLTIDGTVGRLFAVTDDLSDSLFSVNTIAGLPVMEAFATNNVNLGKFGTYPIKIINSGSTAIISGSFTGSMVGNLTGTASIATTASYVLNAVSASFSSTASYVLNAVSSSFSVTAITASYVLNAVSASFTSTASYVNTLNQNVLITGSLTVGSSSLGASENTLTLGARDTSNEGGQLGFNAPGGTYTSASMIDLYQNRLRILRGTNAGSDAEVAWWSMHNKQMALPAYNSVGAFPGTAAGYLAFDTSGNIITVAGAGGGGTPGGSNTQIQYNNSNTFGGVPVLTYDGTTLRATGSFTGSLIGSLTGTASYASTSATASYVLNAVSASFATTSVTASYVLNAVSASFATTSSYVLNAVSASFAATASSVTPLNQSVFISASLTVTGSVNILQNITASRAVISGSTNTASGSILTVIGSGSAQPVFTVIGSSGELFSITDSLSGSLFSVNDISGLPILEVFSDSTTVVGDYQAPSLLTTKAATMNTGNTLIYSIPTASYAGAWFDYTITSASNARCGTVMAMRNGSSIVYTETTTTDIGTTAGVTFMVMITGSSMALTGSATSPSWSFKSIIRSI